MPSRLPTRCRYPGCTRATRRRYCDQHQAPAARMLAVRRGSSAERGYDAQWERLARQRRQLDACLCQACQTQQRLTPSSIVDHIIPLDVRPDWRLELGNTQVLCRACHAQKTARDKQLYGLFGTNTSERRAAQLLTQPPRNDEASTL